MKKKPKKKLTIWDDIKHYSLIVLMVFQLIFVAFWAIFLIIKKLLQIKK